MDDNRDVELRFPPVAEHVRTARLVAVAVARRAGLDDVRLDEVRLAVGEACARAVRRCRRSRSPGPVILVLSDSPTDTTPGLRVEVWDDAHPVPHAVDEDTESEGPDAGRASEGGHAATTGSGAEETSSGHASTTGSGAEETPDEDAATAEGADVVLDESEVIALLTGLADRVDVMDGTAGPEGRVRMVWVHHPPRRARRRVSP